MRLLDGVKADASLSPCGTYRYVLTRRWYPKTGTGSVLWIMLNPSTADADQDDPTLRRCQTFARDWGYDGVTVCNLFALRSTDPKALARHPDPIGPANDEILDAMSQAPCLVVAAWGANGALYGRGLVVADRLAAAGVQLHALGTVRGNHPAHPLYIPADRKPEPWAL